MNSVVVCGKPVSVRISKGESLFVVENESLSIYATGETRDEAVQDFSDQVTHFYHHYKSLSWDRATGSARRLKRLYSDHFKDVPG